MAMKQRLRALAAEMKRRARRRAAPLWTMTSDEKRHRLVKIVLTAKYGREPTPEEVRAALTDGLILRLASNPENYEMGARYYAERGDEVRAERWRRLAAEARARLNGTSS